MHHCHQTLAAFLHKCSCTHGWRCAAPCLPVPQADKELTNLIRRKFAIKCTTGYSLNALVRRNFLKNLLAHVVGLQCLLDEVPPAIAAAAAAAGRALVQRVSSSSLPPSFLPQVDFHTDDPIEIIKRLMIGSEGTLGFVSQVGRMCIQMGSGREVSCTALARDGLSSALVVLWSIMHTAASAASPTMHTVPTTQATYNTVPEWPHKASAFVVFPDVMSACQGASGGCRLFAVDEVLWCGMQWAELQLLRLSDASEMRDRQLDQPCPLVLHPTCCSAARPDERGCGGDV